MLLRLTYKQEPCAQIEITNDYGWQPLVAYTVKKWPTLEGHSLRFEYADPEDKTCTQITDAAEWKACLKLHLGKSRVTLTVKDGGPIPETFCLGSQAKMQNYFAPGKRKEPSADSDAGPAPGSASSSGNSAAPAREKKRRVGDGKDADMEAAEFEPEPEVKAESKAEDPEVEVVEKPVASGKKVRKPFTLRNRRVCRARASGSHRTLTSGVHALILNR